MSKKYLVLKYEISKLSAEDVEELKAAIDDGDNQYLGELVGGLDNYDEVDIVL